MVSPAGASTLITSAPRSPSTQHAIGADQLVEKSITRTPASGPTLSGTASAKNTDFSMPASSHNAGRRVTGVPSAPLGRLGGVEVGLVVRVRALLARSAQLGGVGVDPDCLTALARPVGRGALPARR